MEDQLGPIGTVDPEVRAYVTSLVSALGGTGSYDDGRYVLGDDALAVLKDIKRWLKLYDEKLNRLDVARVLAERNLVKGDLLEILALWPDDGSDDRIKSKIALSCLELLVPLTWPIEKTDLQVTANHLRNIPYLELAQIGYKREVLDHVSSSILRTAVRVGLPSFALPMGERTQRDEGVIKLVLYFLRNIAMISAPPNLPVEWNENEVSRSATIESFNKQDVFDLMLTMASNMGEDFNTQDVVLLELLFHLVKGVDVEKLFMEDEELEAKHSKDLRDLMGKEADMLRGFRKEAPSRHNRFGTMIWVKREDEKVSSVSGQDVLGNSKRALNKMDQTKKWNKPRQRRKEEQTQNHFEREVPLTKSANNRLRSFVEDFLDAGFNPLMQHLRKAIEREAERVLIAHTHQYYYIVAWFLEAERARRQSKKILAARKGADKAAEPESFGLVASVLNQETFILLNRYMQDRLDHKIWHEVNSGMRAFTQILLTVSEMSESPLEDDQEIAENIQNRIFYEETTHDRILLILRGFKDQGFNYLDACTELSHVFLRMLERYSKENGDLQIRSRQRARQKKKESRKEGDGDDDADQDSEAEDRAEAQRLSRERRFDMNRFTAKFANQHCVDTFVALISYYKDLTRDQLKRAHRFFYRVAFKQEMSVMLFRLDMISLFNRMVKGPEPLPKTNPMFKEWEEFIKQIFRRLVKKLQDRPELAVEMLFSKINSTAYYLEYGHEKQTISSKPRAPAELEVKGSVSWEEQIGVVVAALLDDHLDAVLWVKKTLESAADEKQSWEAEAQARQLETPSEEQQPKESPRAPSYTVKSDNDERRVQMFKNNKLRLLMTLSGMDRLGEDEPDAAWIIPSSIPVDKLRETASVIDKHRIDPVTSYGEDGTSAEDMLRRKSQAPARRARAEFDDDSDGLGDFMEEEFLFPVGQKPSSRGSALAELKKKRRKRRGSDDELEPLDEETLKARRKARLLNDLEKRRKIKSTEFVNDSDDEDPEADAEFFAKEEERRRRQARNVAQALTTDSDGEVSKKRKTIDDDSDDEVANKRPRSSDDEAMSDIEDDLNIAVSRRSTSPVVAMDEDASEKDEDETPLSSQSEAAKNGSNPLEPLEIDSVVNRPDATQKGSEMVLNEKDEDEDEDIAPSLPTSRRRARPAAVLDDSDDE